MSSEPRASNRVVIFAGPTRLPVLPDYIERFGPARARDLQNANLQPGDTCLLIDTLFGHVPTVTHPELLALLRAGVRVVGAASAGALRAVELRRDGMFGVGRIYRAFETGLLRDDGEVAVATRADTHEATTLALVQVRYLLNIAVKAGCDAGSAGLVLERSRKMYFLERSHRWLSRVSNEIDPALSQYISTILQDPTKDVKSLDASVAVSVVDSAHNGGRWRAPTFRPVNHFFV
jgi:hypothetical protein